MGEQARRSTPQPARTDFESMTHEQLVALLDSASPEGAAQLATKLSKASSTITKIGDDLMTYVKGLEWQGEGGDAFRDWGGQSAAATLRLGQYAEVASRWLSTVAQAVAEAKAAIPATSETTQAKADLAEARKTLAAAQDPGARNDPDARRLAQTAQSDAAAAQQRMEAARAEAIQQLRKLAQTYEHSAYQVNSVEPPTFSPPARHLGAAGWKDGVDRGQSVTLGAEGSSATGGPFVHAAGGHETGAPGSARPGASVTPPVSAHVPSAEQSTHSQPAAMEIDGVAVPQDTRAPTATSMTTPPTGNGPRPDTFLPPQPVGGPPPMGRGGAPGPLNPTQVLPGTRPPVLPGQGSSGGAVPRVPRESGIVGGRPVSPGAGRPSAGLPRGTVIGAESGHGRTPAGRVSSPGVPLGANPVPGQSTAPGARRLASESGGVFGNRPAQPGRAGPRPFTPGGSGLVRQAGAGESSHGPTVARTGGGTHSAHPSSSRRGNRQDGAERPDYLSEDEETWGRRNQRAVPPVVD
ncbi:hypothetical protein GCM10019016_001820 [Streptomyces prasinosporus]|uniref:Translation initiation factor IF-2 n=2 Tax=Streptomyces TaxID=1883 RepID=A0ABP6TD31_9ACTN|nr:hypothetical protein GCM10010332_73610 [Streptomyces albogriseolus]